MAIDSAATGRSSLGTLLALAATFAVGYVLGARGGDDSEWDGDGREPTEISIDESGTPGERGASESRGEE